MKKIIFILGACLIISQAFVGTSQAQAKPAQTSVLVLKNMSTMLCFENEHISSKAISNFNKSYKGIDNAQWFETKQGGSVCRFVVKDEVNRAYYDKKGNWQYTISDYTEKELPEDVRRQVKSTYYDYNISFAQKIDMAIASKIVYLVQVRNEKDFKTVRVCDGEMDDWEN